MKIKDIETYIDSLDADERRRHAKLIDECLARETEIKCCRDSSLRNLKTLEEAGINLAEALYELECAGNTFVKLIGKTYLNIVNAKDMGHS